MITLNFLLDGRRKHEVKVICRSSVVLAYAHWEQFVHHAAEVYINYVDSRRLSLDKLSLNLQIVGCQRLIKNVINYKSEFGYQSQLIEQLKLKCSETVTLRYDEMKQKSNLDAESFQRICEILGIETTLWRDKYGFINDLYRTRCNIAHGELSSDSPQVEYAKEVLDFVIHGIDHFKTDIENAALNKDYLL
ncbi:MAE_28990/MAE_18760 family HEPN-like nuclease [Phormidium yuhuli AB48]|uniref:MAE_28990/MAE_18760 family HEPN-like nuclease n=2 Tax=Phormidium TaxID=1198 RepID=A0ABY5AVC3_9CYAN|nr:MAE_28990/MAE_18760 family HEPN-like nuclease [Phormidium yuhuli]USR93192.1 MAE_28990/MAE_18760 family HEPN-like nuclease [Phormidium yuhuli AB48]